MILTTCDNAAKLAAHVVSKHLWTSDLLRFVKIKFPSPSSCSKFKMESDSKNVQKGISSSKDACSSCIFVFWNVYCWCINIYIYICIQNGIDAGHHINFTQFPYYGTRFCMHSCRHKEFFSINHLSLKRVLRFLSYRAKTPKSVLILYLIVAIGPSTLVAVL